MIDQPQNRESAIAKVAVPLPLRTLFDFSLAKNTPTPTPGSRVRVPFGQRTLIGLVIEIVEESTVDKRKLKPVLEVLDTEPVFDPPLSATIDWLANYYLAPLGEVISAAMPTVIRQGAALEPGSEVCWTLSEYGRGAALEELQRAPLQLALIKRFVEHDSLTASDFSTDFKSSNQGWRKAINTLIEKGWLTEGHRQATLTGTPITRQPITLNKDQNQAIEKLADSLDTGEFSCSLVHGVTGSGKTEVYFAAMQKAVSLKQQILFLVPEIGLTPQLIERIEASFDCPVVTLHSGLTDNERHTGWWHARQGQAGIVIGTRSAVFTPFDNLGLIVVDEEHDASFKQQDGVRYQARDVAIYRAKESAIPIVLGSATPALETYRNAKQGRYHYIELPTRATATALPRINLLDLRRLPNSDGLSPPLVEAIGSALQAGNQVMLFLNRRGYAPVLYCKECGATSCCHRCDSHLTYHQHINRLRCHHCGYEMKASEQCASCKQTSLAQVGQGTQRVEDALVRLFPDARIARIDRDSTRRKGELADLLCQASNNELDILLGTQLLTKGHDFANVSLVGVLDADQGLYSTDFRASENLFQQVLQVAGRAGRRDQVGEVYIQTAFPEHPFFNFVRAHDFHGFASALLEERASANFPPFGYFALLRAESTHQAKALQFLRAAHSAIAPHAGVKMMDPVPAPMERRAGRYRAQLLVSADKRSALHGTLQDWLSRLESDTQLKKQASSVRWSLDIDPIDLY